MQQQKKKRKKKKTSVLFAMGFLETGVQSSQC
jgi:hypothetical protein